MTPRDSASNQTVTRPAAFTAESGTFRKDEVTLVVEEWNDVQPGRLAWVFPSLDSALDAAAAMRNAARWYILAGRSSDVEGARERGAVLAEGA
jgi:hypothetical protein